MSQTKDIRDAVERELSYDPLIDDSDISVKNINGDVALNGPGAACAGAGRYRDRNRQGHGADRERYAPGSAGTT